MWENLANNWQLIIATVGLTSGIGIVGNYIWRRFTRRLEQSDLESRTNQLEKVTELVELRKKINDKDAPESLLIQVILKTTIATEILKLSRQISRGNKTYKYVATQAIYVIFGILSTLLVSVLSTTTKHLFIKTILIAIGTIVALFFIFLYTAQKEQRRASFEFISSAISSRDQQDDINKIIDLALGGEQFVEDRKGWRGFFLAEKQAKKSFEKYLPDDSPLLSKAAALKRKGAAEKETATEQAESKPGPKTN